MKHIANTSKRRLIAGAVLALLGDVVTTSYGITVLGLSEQNPLIAFLMSFMGVVPALVVTKLLVLGVMFAAMKSTDEHVWAIPAIVILLSGAITLLNAVAIYTA